MDQGIARSSWVFRQTNILKHWKKVWLVLYQSGNLQYFEKEESSRAEDNLFVPNTLEIRVGEACKHVETPKDPSMSKDFLFAVVPCHGSNWQFCAESLDDRTAWQLSLQEAREIRPNLRRSLSRDDLYAYVPGLPVTRMYQPPGYVYYTAPGQVTEVYYVDRPGHYHRGSDFALGMVGGTLLGTAMIYPLFLWC